MKAPDCTSCGEVCCYQKDRKRNPSLPPVKGCTCYRPAPPETFRAYETKLGKRMKKSIIAAFEASKGTTHSSQGLTLGVILNHCLDKEYIFRLEGSSKMGYRIEVLSKRKSLTRGSHPIR